MDGPSASGSQCWGKGVDLAVRLSQAPRDGYRGAGGSGEGDTGGLCPTRLLLGEPHPEPVRWAEVSSVSGLVGLAEPAHAVPGRAHQPPGHRDHRRAGGRHQ